VLAGTTAGLSGQCLGGERIAQGYREAGQVADALAALGRTGEIATADELGVYGVLLGEVSRAAVRATIKQGLGPLLAEQTRRGVPLVATAEAYFASSQRPGATARALSVHVNTVYQRLEAIDRLLGPDWRTEPRCLDLQLLLRLHRASRALGDE
jgi:DNA-binding PucR family transcriptional regulator